MRHREANPPPRGPVQYRRSVPRLRLLLLGSLVGLALGATLAVGLLPSARGVIRSANFQPATAAGPNNFADLLGLPAPELARADIAQVNLLCAEGLPGAEGINPVSARTTLDQWASRVGSETDRYLHKFRQNPADYNNSEAYFRILTMVTVLQQDFHVRYNPERIQRPDFHDSRDLFLHGLLCPTLNPQPSALNSPRGTCVSMPVLYAAVGRRLGYPLKLVTTKAHLFARWESADGKERFNIEATNEGLNCFPDDYYRTWPVPMTRDEVKRGNYLKSLSPAEELAVFLSARGHCLEAAGRLPEAQVAHAHAHVLAPSSPAYLAFLAAAVSKEMPDWRRVQVNLGQAASARPDHSVTKHHQ
jgi:hypothetical protein